MEKKFIKYKEGQVNLARVYKASTGATFDCNDVRDGTLVIGHVTNGKYLVMGYLRGISRSADNNEILYEVENAIENEPAITFIKNPSRVNELELPCFAAKSPDFIRPVVGRIYKCDGELAVMDIGSGKATVNVNSVYELTPYFKETK